MELREKYHITFFVIPISFFEELLFRNGHVDMWEILINIFRSPTHVCRMYTKLQFQILWIFFRKRNVKHFYWNQAFLKINIMLLQINVSKLIISILNKINYFHWVFCGILVCCEKSLGVPQKRLVNFYHDFMY